MAVMHDNIGNDPGITGIGTGSSSKGGRAVAGMLVEMTATEQPQTAFMK